MAAALVGTDSVRVASRRVLADAPDVVVMWSLHPDGRRFLVFVDATRADTVVVRAPPQLIVVTNWMTELLARLRPGAVAER